MILVSCVCGFEFAMVLKFCVFMLLVLFGWHVGCLFVFYIWVFVALVFLFGWFVSCFGGCWLVYFDYGNWRFGFVCC